MFFLFTNRECTVNHLTIQTGLIFRHSFYRQRLYKIFHLGLNIVLTQTVTQSLPLNSLNSPLVFFVCLEQYHGGSLYLLYSIKKADGQ